MQTLLNALYTYAQEHRTDKFLQEEHTEYIQNENMVTSALKQLTAAGGATADYARRVQFGMEVMSTLHEESAFLAGLSMGLELGRL